MMISKTKSSSYKNTLKTSKIKDCPYCKSSLTETEKDFFPCSCNFQACIDCYKDIIRTKGLCPTCHNPLRLDKLNALNASKKDELAKAEADRVPKKDMSKKTTTVIVSSVTTKKTAEPAPQKLSSYSPNENSKFNLKKMNLTDLLKVRILQRNLVYVIGLAPKIAKNDILDKFEYFGQYGKITKIIVNKNNAYNPTAINGPSYSAYLTFSNDIEASIAILAVDQFDIYDRTIRASYGTTKYCTFFLRDQTCPNPDCLYLHRVGNDRDSFMKDESNNNKNVFIDQQKMAMEHLQRHLPEIEKSVVSQKAAKTLFPAMSAVRNKVKEYIKQNALEKEASKEQEPAKTEEKKNKIIETGTPQDKTATAQEKTIENRKSVKKEESEEGSSREDKGDDKSENQKEEEELGKPTLESNKSSFSCQSTNENENSSKKENLTEQKENGAQGESDQATDAIENLEAIDLKKGQSSRHTTECESNKENIDFTQQIFRTFSRESKNDEILEALNEVPFQNEFDKRIVENLFVNLNNSKNSRFKFAQEITDDDYDDPKFDDEQKPETDFEFNVIYKSIQDYVDLSTNTTSQRENASSNPIKRTEADESLRPDLNWTSKDASKEDQQLKNSKSPYGLFNNAFPNNSIKISSGDYNRANEGSIGADQTGESSSNSDKKDSGSKNKKMKNKRKKGNMDINTNTKNKSDINGDNSFTLNQN